MNNPVANRILINSVPKSGTYFVGKMLESAGILPTGYHLRSQIFWNWSEATSLDEIVRSPQVFRKEKPIEETYNLIGPGFTYGHLDHSPLAASLLLQLPDFRHIFLVRDLRACLLSSMRFGETRHSKVQPDVAPLPVTTERFGTFVAKYGRGFLDRAGLQLGWMHEANVRVFRFEDLLNQTNSDLQSETCTALLSFCGADPTHTKVILQKVVGSVTRTWSGERLDWRNYWSETAQSDFKDAGGPDINKAFGYGDLN